MDEIVGGSFTGFTVSTKESLELRLPSLTMIVTVTVPKRFVAGTRVAVRELPLGLKVMFATGSSVGFDELAERMRELIGLSMSPIVKFTVVNASSSIAGGFGIVLSVGRSLTGRTLATNESLLLPPSGSVAVTVINVVPNWLVAGETVTVRLVLLPVKAMIVVVFEPN